MGGPPAAPRVFSDAVRLALTLLVLGVLADDHDATLALDDLALLANRFHRRSDFHLVLMVQFLARQVMRPRLRSYMDISTVTLSPGSIRM